jgi:hypothetical protein
MGYQLDLNDCKFVEIVESVKIVWIVHNIKYVLTA